MKLEWSEVSKPTTECCYTHTIAKTPFGRFQLTWKGWKEDISASMGFDETPWGDVVYDWWGSIDEAKQWAEDEMNKRLIELVPAKVAELKGEVSKQRRSLLQLYRVVSACNHLLDTLDDVTVPGEAQTAVVELCEALTGCDSDPAAAEDQDDEARQVHIAAHDSWLGMREAIVAGIEGFDIDQTLEVLKVIDSHDPFPISLPAEAGGGG